MVKLYYQQIILNMRYEEPLLKSAISGRLFLTFILISNLLPIMPENSIVTPEFINVSDHFAAITLVIFILNLFAVHVIIFARDLVNTIFSATSLSKIMPAVSENSRTADKRINLINETKETIASLKRSNREIVKNIKDRILIFIISVIVITLLNYSGSYEQLISNSLDEYYNATSDSTNINAAVFFKLVSLAIYSYLFFLGMLATVASEMIMNATIFITRQITISHHKIKLMKEYINLKENLKYNKTTP